MNFKSSLELHFAQIVIGRCRLLNGPGAMAYHLSLEGFEADRFWGSCARWHLVRLDVERSWKWSQQYCDEPVKKDWNYGKGKLFWSGGETICIHEFSNKARLIREDNSGTCLSMPYRLYYTALLWIYSAFYYLGSEDVSRVGSNKLWERCRILMHPSWCWRSFLSTWDMA